MVRINNSFEGFTSIKVFDAYLRNLNDYRVAIEVSSLSVVNFLLTIDKNPIIIPTSRFEEARWFIKHLSSTYYKPLNEFICMDDISSALYPYKTELDLIANILFKSKKSYSYCLNDVIDFYLENNLSLEKLLIPKNLVYVVEKIKNEYFKHSPKKFEEVLLEYKILKYNRKPEGKIRIENLYKNPQNLYFKLLEEIIEKAIDFLLLQFYDFLIEETLENDSVVFIRSNKLINIWDELNFVSQHERGKPSLDNKIKLLPFNKKGAQPLSQDSLFDFVVEEWCANLSRALELKTELGLDFVNYLNAHKNTDFYKNYENYVYPTLKALVSYIERKTGLENLSVKTSIPFERII